MQDFLHHPETDRIIRQALAEDIGPGDYTTLSTVPEGQHAQARCLIKATGTLAGLALAGRIFATVDPGLQVEPQLQDGQAIAPGDIAFTVSGDPRSILQAERIVLNCMQRMSGIATLTQQAVAELSGTSCQLLDTRKTTPLIRHLEKWAVAIGGGKNHRFGLYDMVMIKDNHVDYAGGIPQAIQACRRYLADHDLDLRIEVETRNLDEVQQVLDTGGADIILLDNMDLATLRQAVALIDGRLETEASGGVQPGRLRPIAETGVDFISMGALTHSAPSLDISLKAV